MTPSDLSKISHVIIDAVRGEGVFTDRELPVRIVLGQDSLDVIKQKYIEQLQLIKDWEDVTLSVKKEDLSGQGTSSWVLDNCSIVRIP